MKKMRLLSGFAFLLVAAVATGVPNQAKADFQLRVEGFNGPGLTTSFGSLVVHDNGVGDLDPTVGQILFSDNGTFLNANGINALVAAFSNQSMTGLPAAQIQDATVSLRNIGNAQARIVVEISSDNFTFPGSAGDPMHLISTLGISSQGRPAATGTFQSFADNSNALYGQAISTPAQNFVFPVTDPLEDGFFNRSAAYSLSNKFDLTLQTRMTLTAGFTGTTTVQGVPAPSTWLLLGTALPVFGIGRWLRRRGRFML